MEKQMTLASQKKFEIRRLVFAMSGVALTMIIQPRLAQAQTASHVPPSSDASAPAIEPTSQSGSSATNGIPMTVSVVSRKALDQQQPADSYEALRGSAGVSTGSGGTVADNVTIRGIVVDARTSYRLNGALPINNFIAMPMEDKQAEEALKGAAALLFGVASPSGIVNLVTKRAGDKPNASVGVSGNTNGEVVGSVDVGRKFGKDNQFGIRVNAAGGHLSNSINDVDGSRKFVSVAADWKPIDRLSFKLDYEDVERNMVEQSTIGLLAPVNGRIPLPAVPNPNKLLSGSWANYKASEQNVLFRADFRMTENWSLLGEIGRSELDRDNRDISRIVNYDPVTGQGTLQTQLVRDQDYVNKYGRVEVNGKFSTGPFGHRLTFGLMANDRYQNNPSVQTVKLPQNLYDPIVLPEPIRTTPIVDLPQESRDTGLYMYDRVSVGRRLFLMAGIRRTAYSLRATQASGPESTFDSTNYAPAFGITFVVRPDTSVYASYLTGLEETGLAPSTASNAFQALRPSVAKQKELGIRSTALYGLATTLSYFDIDRATAALNAQNLFTIDGRTLYKGVEASLNGDLTRQLSFSLAGQYLHARTSGSSDPTLTGTRPENTPSYTLSLAFQYHPRALPGTNFSVGMFRTGNQAVNNADQGFIPAYTVYIAGVGYSTRLGGHNATFQLNVNNLTNDRHFSAAGSGLLLVGAARSIRFGAKMDF
jgi:iron complex outermembrane receptor protein